MIEVICMTTVQPKVTCGTLPMLFVTEVVAPVPVRAASTGVQVPLTGLVLHCN